MDAKLKEVLLQVEKPARYIGGEFNLPNMDKPCLARVCLCFPDIYEIGMSNIGVRILYHMLNDKENIVCERCFAPAEDMANVLKANNLPLFSVDTARSLKSFDVVGFSIGYEMLYTNILYMMDLAGIPFRAQDRDDSYPIMIAGGPCVMNPEPFADFFDAIMVGEGEINLNNFMDKYVEAKAKGITKNEFLQSLVGQEGIYIPSANDRSVKKAVVKDFNQSYFPTKILTPNIEITHDRAVLELYRGCSNGCRFCQAGFYYRPIRERKADTLIRQAEELIKNSGYDEISLASLSTSDYSELSYLIEHLRTNTCREKVKLSLPSLRLDSYKEEYLGIGRLGSLTFAPEAGTQRLRNVINKNISDQDIEENIAFAIKKGYNGVKLYFMMGLPTETDEDIMGIVDIVKRIRSMAWQEHKKGFNITVSTSVFIPKPCTPFQWEEQISLEEIFRRQSILRTELKLKGVKYNWHDAYTSVVEAVLARGDRKLSTVLEKVYSLGAKFDGWSEHFKWERWVQAFEECGVDMKYYTDAIPLERELPWDNIDCGIPKKYFIKEKQLATTGEQTKACNVKECRGCGANKLGQCFANID